MEKVSFKAMVYMAAIARRRWVYHLSTTDHEGAQYVFKAIFHCQAHFSHFCVRVFSATQLRERHFWCMKSIQSITFGAHCSQSMEKVSLPPFNHWSRGRPVCVEHSQRLHYLLSTTDHEGAQYVLNIPCNCIIFYRSQCLITNCRTFPAIAVSFIVLSVLSQIVQGYFPVSVSLQSFLCSCTQYHSASRASPLVYSLPHFEKLNIRSWRTCFSSWLPEKVFVKISSCIQSLVPGGRTSPYHGIHSSTFLILHAT